MDGLSNSDVALLSRDGGDMWNNGSGIFWVFALLILAGGGNFFGNNGYDRNYVTSSELQASQNAQTNAIQFQSIASSIANGQYETARLISDQNSQMMAQNNANLINAIQGFNNLGMQLTNQTNILGSKLDGLAAQMASCCCEIKTQMLQDRLSDTQAKLVTAQNAIDNANQIQYILGQMGRWVAWAGSGSQTVATGA
jgi:hypothetical protein